MNRQEHLLDILGEECSELHQVASKILRFGRFHTKPNSDKTNVERLEDEFNDLIAMVEMLADDGFVFLQIDQEKIKAKKLKVEEYLKVSKMMGTLQEYG